MQGLEPGRLLALDEVPHPPILGMAAAQLKVPTGAWHFYAERHETRREHLLELLGAFRLPDIHARPLPAIRGGTCLPSRPDTPRHPAGPSVGGKPRKAKIIIPSLAVVERCCAEVVTRAQRRLYKRLTAPLGENQKKKLETLLNVGQGTHQTILAWLRQPAGSPSARNLLDHVAKLQALRQVGLPPDIGRKVDKGILEEKDGVQLLKPMPELAALLDKANANRIFGTKMRSFIKQANAAGVKAIVSQQFEMAAQISAAGLVPIVEPEVDIHCPEKAKAEALLKAGILEKLNKLPARQMVMLKVTLPEEDNFYADCIKHPNVLKVRCIVRRLFAERSK